MNWNPITIIGIGVVVGYLVGEIIHVLKIINEGS